MATTLAHTLIAEISQGDYGVIVSNEQDNEAFAQRFLPAFTTDEQLASPFCSPYVAIIMRDIWLIYYYGRDQVIVNQKNTMIHSVRYALLQAITSDSAIENLEKACKNEADRAFIYAAITVHHLIHWLKAYVLQVDHLDEDYQLVQSIKMQKYHEVYEELASAITPLPRHWVVAQANVVKAIHQSLAQEEKLFSSVMKDVATYCASVPVGATVAMTASLVHTK